MFLLCVCVLFNIYMLVHIIRICVCVCVGAKRTNKRLDVLEYYYFLDVIAFCVCNDQRYADFGAATNPRNPM